MGNKIKQPAPASGDVKIPAENQPQPQLPPEYQPRRETGTDLNTFLDENELLARLPICRRTAHNWIKAGKLPVVKIGRRKIYHWGNVQAALLRMERNAL